MKTGMELVKKWRERAFKILENSTSVDASSGGYFDAADELEAWLREAGEFLENNATDYNMSKFPVDMFRDKLLGTTQSSGGSGEGEK